MKWLLPLVVVGGLAAGGFFLFATPEGRRMMGSITSSISGYDDPFKYYEGNEEAFEAGSDAWKKIQKRIYEKKSNTKSNKNKDVQKQYIETYLADAF